MLVFKQLITFFKERCFIAAEASFIKILPEQC